MFRFFPVLFAFGFLLAGCTPFGLATGAGAAAGVAAGQEGGISRAASDARIQVEINDLWFRYDVETFRKLDLTINQGRVLITGVVQNPENRVEAVRLAWQPKGVKQVINEVRIADSQGIVGFARDTWITTRIRTALTFNKEILSINYSIDTVQGTVYLMGFAQSRQELNRVVEIARTVSGVNGVVSYVRFANGYGDTLSGPNDELTYQSTFDDQFVVEDPYQPGQYQPYDDPNAPLDLRARQNNGGAGNVYPNTVAPVQAEPLGDSIIIREPVSQNSLPVQPPVQQPGLRSEDILWDDQ